MICNNISHCHNLQTIDDTDAQRVICDQCKHVFIIRKEPIKNVPEKRLYAKIFKKDILQGKDNLFYKYHPEYLSH